MKVTKKEFGKEMQNLREAAGFTQAEMAQKMGYSTPQFISNVERGICYLPISRVKDWCRLTKTSPAMILKKMYEVELVEAARKNGIRL